VEEWQTTVRRPNPARAIFVSGPRKYCENLPVILLFIYINIFSNSNEKSLSAAASSIICRTDAVITGIHHEYYAFPMIKNRNIALTSCNP
jgi:hypothetical protein